MKSTKEIQLRTMLESDGCQRARMKAGEIIHSSDIVHNFVDYLLRVVAVLVHDIGELG